MSALVGVRMHYATPSSPKSSEPSVSYDAATTTSSIESFKEHAVGSSALAKINSVEEVLSCPGSDEDQETPESSSPDCRSYKLPGIDRNSESPGMVAKQIIRVHRDWTIAINGRAVCASQADIFGYLRQLLISGSLPVVRACRQLLLLPSFI